jgi:ATP-dependent exoDNAse (exonuclease V) beta subunit
LFGPLRDEHAIPRKAVTAIVGDASYVIEDEPIVPAGASTSPSFSRDDQARIGSMVHALVQHWPVCPAAVAPGSRDDRLNDRALTLYRRLLDRPDFRALFDSGDRLHEVPFSARLDRQDLDALGLLAEPAPLIVRGSIDCLVLQPEGKVTIVELKTGRPRATDRLQMAVYERAVQAMFPESQIEAALVFVEEVPGAGC